MNVPHDEATKRAPKVLAVTSGKGGVGKTFISVHLASYAARSGQRTLLLDADLGLANVDVMLGLSPVGTIADVLHGGAELSDIMIPVSENLDVLPGGSGLSELTQLDAQAQIRLLGELETLGSRYDLAIVDTGAGIGDNVLYFVSSAQAALVVLTPDPTSLTDAYALIKVLSKQRDVRRFMVLVNQAEEFDAQLTFRRLLSVADRYLDVYLDYVGHLPPSKEVQKHIRLQQTLQGQSAFAEHLDKLLAEVLARPVGSVDDGRLQLFWQHSLRAGLVAEQVGGA
jgi:flagellar biosynthesis protein FlhG